MKFLLKILAATVSVFIASYIIPGVDVADFLTAGIVAIVLGVFNALVKPVILILTLPVTILTLGLFYFIVNAVIVLIVAQLVPGFTVDSVFTALIFSLAVSLFNSFLSSLTN